MSTEPEVLTRAEQPYVAIRTWVPMSGLAGVAALHPEVFAWLGARGLAPAGAPFFKYNVIDMARELEVEAGVPVAAGQGLSWDVSPGDRGERWGGRLEIYLTDPSVEPDMSKWETQLAFRLAG